MVETESKTTQPAIHSRESKAVAVMRRRFTKIAKEYCPERSGEFCEKTKERCSLENCPKMKEYLGMNL